MENQLTTCLNRNCQEEIMREHNVSRNDDCPYCKRSVHLHKRETTGVQAAHEEVPLIAPVVLAADVEIPAVVPPQVVVDIAAHADVHRQQAQVHYHFYRTGVVVLYVCYC